MNKKSCYFRAIIAVYILSNNNKKSKPPPKANLLAGVCPAQNITTNAKIKLTISRTIKYLYSHRYLFEAGHI
jgi:hypothetical protein